MNETFKAKASNNKRTLRELKVNTLLSAPDLLEEVLNLFDLRNAKFQCEMCVGYRLRSRITSMLYSTLSEVFFLQLLINPESNS